MESIFFCVKFYIFSLRGHTPRRKYKFLSTVALHIITCRCSDYRGGNRGFINSSSVWALGRGECDLWDSLCRELFSHTLGSNASVTLLRCDTANKRRKDLLFSGKSLLHAILFSKGVDNSAFLRYYFPW